MNQEKPQPLTTEELDRMGVPDDRQALGNAEISEESERLRNKGPMPNPNACINH